MPKSGSTKSSCLWFFSNVVGWYLYMGNDISIHASIIVPDPLFIPRKSFLVELYRQKLTFARRNRKRVTKLDSADESRLSI